VWFAIGAALTLVIDWIATPWPADGTRTLRTTNWIWLIVAGYGVSTAILAAALVGARLRSRNRPGQAPEPQRFRFVLPLVVGTFSAFTGSTYFDYITRGSHDSLNAEYFSQVSQVIPLLLIALGFEAKQFHRYARNYIGLAATIATVTIIIIGEVAALTILPMPVTEHTNAVRSWQEYAAFVATLQACSVGLVMLAWALITAAVTSRNDPAEGSGRLLVLKQRTWRTPMQIRLAATRRRHKSQRQRKGIPITPPRPATPKHQRGEDD
jgi:hypothetical protein